MWRGLSDPLGGIWGALKEMRDNLMGYGGGHLSDHDGAKDALISHSLGKCLDGLHTHFLLIRKEHEDLQCSGTPEHNPSKIGRRFQGLVK